jgi:hypothetical protein
MTRKNLIPALLLPAVVAAMPAYSQTAAPVPTAKEIIELTKKAVGGDAYFKIKPYCVSYTNMINADDPREVSSKGYYKDGKWCVENTIFKIKNQLTFTSKTITDVAGKTWESQSTVDNGKWKQLSVSIRRLFPFYNPVQWEKSEFDITLIKENGMEYFRLHAVNPYSSDWTYTLFINTRDYLVYKWEEVNAKQSIVILNVFDNYKNFGGIMLPLKMTSTQQTIVRRKRSETSETITILDFAFKNDIPDSLFVVPK